MNKFNRPPNVCVCVFNSSTQPSFISEVGAPGRSALDSVEVAYGRQVSVLHLHDVLIKVLL